MNEDLIPLVIMPTLFYLIGFITRTLSDNRVRRELINVHADSAMVENLFLKTRSENPENALKWGIVGVAIGVALVLIEILNLSGEQPMTYGLMFAFGGAGLLCFYMIKRLRDDDSI
jgi:hypothetical protein